MAYNRVGTPKFYIDAVLLARKLGMIQAENPHGLFYLNPTINKFFDVDADGRLDTEILFNSRYFCNSITDIFVLGHSLNTFRLSGVIGGVTDILAGNSNFSYNGWTKFPLLVNTDVNAKEVILSIRNETDENALHLMCNEFSVCWSYSMPHSPDLELTQSFSNESLKTQTTKGGHTLTSTGWQTPPKWGNKPQWRLGESFVGYPARRSWNLKFSYLSDNHATSPLMPEYYNEIDTNNHNRGIFERTSVTLDDPLTADEDESSESFSIKDDFLSKVMPSINLGLPFIFQPNQNNVEEYAICRVNSDSVVLNQVANNVYDISMNIVETW